MNLKPYLLALSIAGCTTTQPPHRLPSVNKDVNDLQIFRVARIACIYDGTVKVHRSGTSYTFEGDDSCSPTTASWDRASKEADMNGDYKITPQELSDLEEKVCREYAK